MPTNPFSSGPKGYTPKTTKGYESGLFTGIGNRAGATPDGKGGFDYSNSFKPIQGPSGVASSTAGYNFNPMNNAISGLQKPGKLSRVNFQNYAKNFGDVAYENMARDLRSENSGNLTRLNENIGTRRPGLLMKASQDANRDLEKQLAQGRYNIERDIMDKNIQLDKDEQLTNADLQKSENEMNLDRLFKLGGLGSDLVSKQSGLVQNERDYADKALEMLLEAWKTSGGFANEAAGIQSKNRGDTLGFLGSMVGAIPGTIKGLK